MCIPQFECVRSPCACLNEGVHAYDFESTCDKPTDTECESMCQCMCMYSIRVYDM